MTLLVGSGGVLRHALEPGRILGALTGVSPEGWQLPSDHASWWTGTTSSRQSACSRSGVPPPRHWHVACRGATRTPQLISDFRERSRSLRRLLRRAPPCPDRPAVGGGPGRATALRPAADRRRPLEPAAGPGPVRRRPGRRVVLALPRHLRGGRDHPVAAQLLPRRGAPGRLRAVHRRARQPARGVGAAHRIPRKLAAPLVVILGIGFIALLITFVSNQVARGWATSPSRSPTASTRSVTGCGRAAARHRLPAQRGARPGPGADLQYSKDAVGKVGEVGTAVGHVVAGIFIVLFSTYFFLADGHSSGPGSSGSSRAPAGSRPTPRAAWPGSR